MTKKSPGQATARLDRQTIVTEALTLIDAEGLDGFSMRRLAARLGTGAATLYWHFRDSHDLLGEVAGAAMAVAPTDFDLSAPWEEQLLAIARHTRRAWLAHPNVVPLNAQISGINKIGLQLAEHVLTLLTGNGFDDDAAIRAYNAYLGYVLGFMFTEAHGVTIEPETQERLKNDLHDLPADRYPTVARLMPRLENQAFGLRWAFRPLSDEDYEAGLNALLVGLEAWRNQPRSEDRTPKARARRPPEARGKATRRRP